MNKRMPTALSRMVFVPAILLIWSGLFVRIFNPAFGSFHPDGEFMSVAGVALVAVSFALMKQRKRAPEPTDSISQKKIRTMKGLQIWSLVLGLLSGAGYLVATQQIRFQIGDTYSLILVATLSALIFLIAAILQITSAVWYDKLIRSNNIS